jgi:hypothetical protein
VNERRWLKVLPAPLRRAASAKTPAFAEATAYKPGLPAGALGEASASAYLMNQGEIEPTKLGNAGPDSVLGKAGLIVSDKSLPEVIRQSEVALL